MNTWNDGGSGGYAIPRQPHPAPGGQPGSGPQYSAPQSGRQGEPASGYPGTPGEPAPPGGGYVLPHVAYLGVAAAALGTLFALLVPWTSVSDSDYGMSGNAFSGSLTEIWPILMIAAALAALILTFAPVSRRKHAVLIACGALLGATVLEFVYVQSVMTALSAIVSSIDDDESAGLGAGAWLALGLAIAAMVSIACAPGEERR